MKRSLLALGACLSSAVADAATCHQQLPAVLEQLQQDVVGELTTGERQRAASILADLCANRGPGADRNLRTAPAPAADVSPGAPIIVEPITVFDIDGK
ncbi:MAG: hypothetical protein AB8B93_12635, partial [Pseudomonadales bacterium]